MRQINPEIKLLIGLGGTDQGANVYHELAQKSTQKVLYANSVRDLVNQFNLDGIDFDWQYPGYVKK